MAHQQVTRKRSDILLSVIGDRIVLPVWSGRVYLAIATAPLVFWAASILAGKVWTSFYVWVASEDRVLENLQVAALLAGVATAGAAAVALRRRGRNLWAALYVVGAVALFWWAGEEISWGQRLFGWDTPHWLGANMQGETNLHNFPGVGVTISRVGLGIVPFLSIASLLLWMQGPSFARRWQLHLWVPHPALIASWLCIWSYRWIRWIDLWYYERDDVHQVVSRLQESQELILYAAILVFLVTALSCIAQEPRASVETAQGM